MKKLFTILLLALSLQSFSQIDRAIDDKINAGVSAEIKKFIQIVGFDTVVVRNYSAAANVDTLRAALNTVSIYEIVCTGNITCVRYYAVRNKGGVYTVAVSEYATFPLPTGVKFTSTAIKEGILLQVTGTSGGFTYQRQKKNL